MDKALYRKYRSKNWNEVIGQDHAVTTLRNSIKSGKISHAYLLSGPRGVGKTSIARIIAHEVNNLKYDETQMHLDIIEIDAASNRRIDEIRDLRDKVHIAPTSAKYKIYIIDEVHMLTKEAFNALLKTLEEPPGHCIFILATTEAHKLPPTIVSRTQRYTLNPVSADEVATHLKKIAKSENINISDDALNLIAEHGEGSFRDSINMLDQLRGYEKSISSEDVSQLLGLPPPDLINKLAQSITQRKSDGVIETLEKLRLSGYSPVLVAQKLSPALRNELVANNSPELVKFIKELLEVSVSGQPQEYLELICLAYCINSTPVKQHTNNDINDNASDIVEEAELTHTDIQKKTIQKNNVSEKEFSKSEWSNILSIVKNDSPSLYTVLRLAQITSENNGLLLTFAFSLHYKKATQTANKQILSKILKDNYSNPPLVSYKLDRSLVPEADSDITETQKPNQEPDNLDTISNIFGGGEVLES